MSSNWSVMNYLLSMRPQRFAIAAIIWGGKLILSDILCINFFINGRAIVHPFIRKKAALIREFPSEIVDRQ